MIVRAQMVQVLGGRQRLEELDDARIPVGDVPGQLFQHGRGALAPAEGDGIGHLGARAADGGHDAVERPVADQVADVGHDPRRAGLDEEIVVHLVQILGHHLGLLGQHDHEIAQRIAAFGVAQPVDGREQVVEFSGRIGHGWSFH
ncbi:MAG: hypothetical protein R2838_20830 [Caldilineaceae bacterium]